MSDEDVTRLNSVRKQIWAAGYTGFFIGAAWGLGNCVIYKASGEANNVQDARVFGDPASMCRLCSIR